jgi:hypothetical protein
MDLPTLLKADDLDAVAEIISQAIAELMSAYSRMLRHLELKLFEALDHHSTTTDLRNRAKIVSGISGDFRLDAFSLRLAEYSGEDQDIESLVSLAVNKPSRDWTDRDIEGAVIQFGIWGMEFRRVEILAPMKNRPATRKAFAVAFGQGDSSKTTSTIIDVATQDKPAIMEFTEKLRAQRPKDALGCKLFFAALVELGAEIANEYTVRK